MVFIRQATYNDKDFVTVLDRENMTPIITDTGEKYYGQMFESFSPKKVFVIEDDNHKLLGFARIHIPGNSLDVWSFQIKNTFQGMGYGKKLMGFLVSFAKGKNLKKIILEAHKTNFRAIKFYESLGFTKTAPKSKKKEKVGFVLSLK